MKTVDYINTLIKEKEHLTALCKSHVETIRSIKRELGKLNNTISKKDKRIIELEGEIKTPTSIIQKEFDDVKNELSQLKEAYAVLERKYDSILQENSEYKRIFDEIENICDSD
jgi:chromosome segregation ATPase